MVWLTRLERWWQTILTEWATRAGAQLTDQEAQELERRLRVLARAIEGPKKAQRKS